MSTGSYGIDAERRRREISAHFGVPDFIFRPLDIRKGAAKREIGDFLMWVGQAVAVVSVKSREPDAAGRETQDRRRRWLDSNIAAAYKQILGTVRTLRSTPRGDLVLMSERGVEVPWDAASIGGYVGVVIVDVPDTEEDYAPPLLDDDVPAIAVLAREWDALNELLPSTISVLQYVVRRHHLIPRCPLGAELDVMALVIEHENSGRPFGLPPGGLPKDYFEQVAEDHPDWFLGGHPDDDYAFVIDTMIEGAADPDPAISDISDPTLYMRVVEFLDRIPLLSRVTLGKSVIEYCERAGVGGRHTFRVAVPHGMFVFWTEDAPRAKRASWLRSVTGIRHSQALDAGAPPSLITLGVSTQPIPSREGRSHDFVLIEGPLRSDDEFRALRDSIVGTVDMAPLVERWRSGT